MAMSAGNFQYSFDFNGNSNSKRYQSSAEDNDPLCSERALQGPPCYPEEVGVLRSASPGGQDGGAVQPSDPEST